MPAVVTGLQFVAGCLVVGLGLFLAAGAAREVFKGRLVQAVVVRAIGVVGGVILLAAGSYAAFLALPL